MANWKAYFLGVLVVVLAGCHLAATPAPTLAPTLTTTASVTPDIYATSARRTLEAMAAQATANAVTLTAEAATGSQGRATPTATGAAADEPSNTWTPLPTATPTFTTAPSLAPTFTPLPGGTPISGATPYPTTQANRLIRSFDALPLAISPGDAITLTWSAVGDWATLYRLNPVGTLAEFWTVPLVGTRTFTTDESTRNAVRYVLFVGEDDATESAMVSVSVACEVAWFFSNPPADCPQFSARMGAGAAQLFERGRMYWLETEGRIYVLFGDGGSPAYAIYSDPWQPGMPDSDPSIEPPEGFVQPVHGFGMIWRGEGGGAGPEVRERLGWGLAPEAGYSGAAVQCDSAPKYNTCYLGAPGGEVIVLEPERSGWYVRE